MGKSLRDNVESYYGCLSEPQDVSALWKETAQTHVFVLPPSLLLNHFNRLLTHNTTRHCRVLFYAFVGQPLSKQLYFIPCHGIYS